MSEKLYYMVCEDGTVGLSIFDLSNDSMSCMEAKHDKNKWKKFTEEEAKEAERILDFYPIPAE